MVFKLDIGPHRLGFSWLKLAVIVVGLVAVAVEETLFGGYIMTAWQTWAMVVSSRSDVMGPDEGDIVRATGAVATLTSAATTHHTCSLAGKVLRHDATKVVVLFVITIPLSGHDTYGTKYYSPLYKEPGDVKEQCAFTPAL